MATDYRDMKTKKPGEKKKADARPLALDGYWWRYEGRQLADALTRAANHVESQQSYRTAANLRHTCIYGNFDAAGFSLHNYARSMSGLRNQLSYNVIAACVDTLHAKMGKNRPRPSFQTYGGDWKLQRRALGLNKFTQGLFHEMDIYQHAQLAEKDAFVLGTGALKFLEQDGRVRCERVFPEFLKVDDADGIHGTPRQLFQFALLPKEVVLNLYASSNDTKRNGEISEAVRACQTPHAGMGGAEFGIGEMIVVREAWHLPSGKGAKDGKHALAIDGACLFEEDWEKEHFPFAFLRYQRRQLGFWGQGLAERLWGIQLEINRAMRARQEILRMLSVPKWWVPKDSNIAHELLRGGHGAIGDIVTGDKPPQMLVPNAVAPEHFQHVQELWARAFEQEGISQLSATAQKPAGLSSGKALQTYNDIESERFSIVGQDIERFVALESGEICIDLARDLAMRKGGKYEVNNPIRKALEPIRWEDINLARDAYVMQALPVSSLPSNPAARLEMVEIWESKGWVDPIEARRLVNMPDLEASDTLATAALDDVDATIEAVLDGKDVPPVDELQNLQLLLSRTQAAILRAKHQGAPQGVLDNLRDLWTGAANALKAAEAGASPDAPAGPPALPPDAGMPMLPPGAEMAGPPPGAPMPAPGMQPGMPGLPPDAGGLPPLPM